MICGAMPRVLLALVLAPLLACAAEHEVSAVSLPQLAVQSELIAVAKVNKLVTRREGTFANVTPTEFWKGSAKGDCEILISSSLVCDTSTAVPGERAVLFLSPNSSGQLVITHHGRGRMPLVTIDGREIVRDWGDVLLTDDASVVTVANSALPSSTGVELSELKRLVTAALEAAKRVPSAESGK